MSAVRLPNEEVSHNVPRFFYSGGELLHSTTKFAPVVATRTRQ
jgi:hypothetical protein